MNSTTVAGAIPPRVRNGDRVYPDGLYEGTTVHVDPYCSEQRWPRAQTAPRWTAIQAYVYLMPRWCPVCQGGRS